MSFYPPAIVYNVHMRNFIIPLSAFLVFLLPAVSLAQSVSSSSSSSVSSSASSSSSSVDERLHFSDVDFNDVDLDDYSDVSSSWDHDMSVSISALTHAGVLRGNDDGTFRPSRTLNRAEFMQIIMRLTDDDAAVNTNCFPDVTPSAWYAIPVCRAKAGGIVRGNAVAGVPASQWRFEPARDVQYEEAVKVLAVLYALPVVGDTEGMDWYVPFIEAADDEDLSVGGLEPGDRITRGEMARLTAAFVAHAEGRLDDLRDAEEQSSSSSSSLSSSSRSSSSSSSSSGTGSGVFDPDSDTALRSRILVLGEVSPVVAGVNFFSNSEPVNVENITVTFTSGIDSIDSLLVYDEDGELLGTATAVGGTSVFRATIPNDFQLPHREDVSVYVRARLKEADEGGESGEHVQVASVNVAGTGEWTDEGYSTTSTDTFPASMTAHGTITDVTNTGNSQTALTGGTERLLGEFRFTAESPEALHDVRITALDFIIEQVGGVTLDNVFLRPEGSNEEHSCTTGATTVACAGIPAAIGEVDDIRIIRVYGDVTVPSGSDNRSLRLVLNNPGTPSEAGAITWSDTETVFDWVPLDQPVANGTLHD